MNGFRLPAFYPVLDTGVLASRGLSATAAAEAILDAGARVLQFRHKEFFSRAVFEEAERVAALCRAANALFVMNDRADLAALLGAALHLGQDDLAPADARKILTPDGVIGFSTHNREQLRAADAEPVDYLAIGPIFATGSKQNPDPVLGVDGTLQASRDHEETTGRDRRHYTRNRALRARSRRRLAGSDRRPLSPAAHHGCAQSAH